MHMVQAAWCLTVSLLLTPQVGVQRTCIPGHVTFPHTLYVSLKC